MVEEAHQQRTMARARELHDMFACCRKHLEFINIAGFDELRYAQNQSIRQQQTEGVTVRGGGKAMTQRC